MREIRVSIQCLASLIRLRASATFAASAWATPRGNDDAGERVVTHNAVSLACHFVFDWLFRLEYWNGREPAARFAIQHDRCVLVARDPRHDPERYARIGRAGNQLHHVDRSEIVRDAGFHDDSGVSRLHSRRAVYAVPARRAT